MSLAGQVKRPRRAWGKNQGPIKNGFVALESLLEDQLVLMTRSHVMSSLHSSSPFVFPFSHNHLPPTPCFQHLSTILTQHHNMASQEPPSVEYRLAVLKQVVRDHNQNINLLGLLKTNLLADVTGLQKTVSGLQNTVSELQHTVASLEHSTIDRQKAT